MAQITPENLAWRLMFGPDQEFPYLGSLDRLRTKKEQDSFIQHRKIQFKRFKQKRGFEFIQEIYDAIITGKLRELTEMEISQWLYQKNKDISWSKKWLTRFDIIFREKITNVFSQSKPKEKTSTIEESISESYRLEVDRAEARQREMEKVSPNELWIAKRDENLREDYWSKYNKNPSLSVNAWANEVRSERAYLCRKKKNQGALLSLSYLRSVPNKTNFLT